MHIRSDRHTLATRKVSRALIDKALANYFTAIQGIPERVRSAIKGCNEETHEDGFCDCVREITAMVIAGTADLEKASPLPRQALVDAIDSYLSVFGNEAKQEPWPRPDAADVYGFVEDFMELLRRG